MAQHAETLEAFVPRLVRERFLPGGGPPVEPRQVALQGCVLLADVSGFTPLVEELSADRAQGAESIQLVLNRLFGPLAERIEAWGGEVLCFPGDAALALWTAPGPGELADAVRRAAQCGLDVQREFDGLRDERGLRLRVAIGAGPLSAACVGGVDGRWESLVQGDPLQQLAGALSRTAPGQVAASRPARDLLADNARGHVTGDCLLIDSIAGAERPLRVAMPEMARDDALRAFVPRSVQARLRAGQRDWMAEFRQVTVAFLGLDELPVEARGLELLQKTVSTVQEIVYRYEGSVNQIVEDEKGTVLVLVWGSALHTHEDDAVRAVRAVLDIRRELSELGVTSRAGIATERVFAGRRGSPLRAEFGLMGSGVNRAARLRTAADGVLCDGPTRARARGELAFAARPPVSAKGLPAPVEVYEPIGERPHADGLVGRKRERELLDRYLGRLESGRKGALVCIEGEAGIGKSRLIAHLLDRAQGTSVRALVSRADAIEQAASYHPWKPVLAALLGADTARDAGLLRERIDGLLGAEQGERVALLSPLLPEVVPDTSATEPLSAQGRAQGLREIFTGVLSRAAVRDPLLLVIEDVHWMDSASWQLLDAVSEQIPELLIVLSARPMADGLGEEARRMLERENAHALELDVLSMQDALTLACQRLQVDELPEEVAQLIRTRAEGHPFFTEELAYSLRDRGHLRIEDGRCHLTGELGAIARLDVPDTVQGVVTSRIDRLSVEQQLTLKVASVIGRSFTLQDLQLVHPIAGDREVVPDQVADMTRLRLLRGDGDGTVSFRHAITQDTCYALLPHSQRCELHQRVAEHLERSAGTTASAHYARLAHHWQRADVTQRAMEYLALAAEQALLRDYANGEAAHFYTELLALDDGSGAQSAPEHDFERARWEYELGEALFNLGRHTDGMPHLENALRLLGEPLPSRAQIPIRVLAGLVHRLVRRNVRYSQKAISPNDRRRWIEAQRAYERLITAGYTTGNTVLGFYTGLRGMKLGERTGPGPAIARLYADFSNVLQAAGSNRNGDLYSQLAISAVEQGSDLAARAHVLQRANLHRSMRGLWDCIEGMDESIALSELIGNDYQWEESSSMRGYVELLLGEPARAGERFAEVGARARRSGAIVHQLWSLSGQADAALRTGRLDDAIELATEALELRERSGSLDQVTPFQAGGVLVSAWLRLGGRDRSAPWAERAREAMTIPARLGYGALSGYVGILEHHLPGSVPGLEDPPVAREDLQVAAKVCRSFRISAITRPILRAAALRCDGERLWHLGKRQRAVAAWRRSIATAEELSLGYDRARAEVSLGARLPPGDPERRALLDRARTTFEQIGALWDLEHAPGPDAG